MKTIKINLFNALDRISMTHDQDPPTTQFILAALQARFCILTHLKQLPFFIG